MITGLVNRGVNWLTRTTQKPRAMWLFERLVYLWFIFNGLAYLGSRQIFWGVDSVFMIPNYSQGVINNFFYILIYSRQFDDLIYFSHIAAAFLALIGVGRAIPKLIVWITGLMLYYAAWSLFNSGFLLCCLYGFYLVFASPTSKRPTRIVLTNLALLACIIQLLLVYAESAAYKLSGDMWWQGSAFYYAINLEQFSSAGVREFFNANLWLSYVLTYGGLLYQALFPFVVWIKKIKRIWLAFGVCFHFFIALFMGLPDFGTAMLLGYVLFIDEKTWKEMFAKMGLEYRFRH